MSLGAEPFDSCFSCFSFELLRRIYSNHQYGHFRILLGKLSRRFQSIHFRHQEIHHREIWFLFAKGFNGIASVASLAHHYPLGFLFEHFPKMAPDHRVVIHQKNTNHEGLDSSARRERNGPTQSAYRI